MMTRSTNDDCKMASAVSASPVALTRWPSCLRSEVSTSSWRTSRSNVRTVAKSYLPLTENPKVDAHRLRDLSLFLAALRFRSDECSPSQGRTVPSVIFLSNENFHYGRNRAAQGLAL